jgi:tetratricopeptide (TPR) repeat protein
MARVMVMNPPLYFPETHGIVRRAVEKELVDLGRSDVLSKIPAWFAQRHQPGYEVHQFWKLEHDYRLARGENNPAQQEKALSEMLNFPENPICYWYGLQYVRLLLKQKRYEEARVLTDRIIRRKAGFYEAYALGAEAARAIDKPLLAAEYLAERKRFYPEDLNPVQVRSRQSEAFKNWGAILSEHGRSNAAVNQFQTALNLMPESAEVHYEWGAALLRMGDMDAAVDHFQQAIEIQPGHAGAYNKMGMIAFRQGKFKSALKRYQTAIAINPDDAEVYLNWGILLAYQRKLDQAVTLFRKAVDINPQSFMAHNLLGQALAGQQRIPEAMDSFQQALAINARDVKVLKNLGILFYEQGKVDRAVEYFQRVVDLVPDDADAHDKLKMLRKLTANRSG